MEYQLLHQVGCRDGLYFSLKLALVKRAENCAVDGLSRFLFESETKVDVEDR